MIRAAIIEDEQQLCETNELLLKENFPNIEIVGTAKTVEGAIKVIKETSPQLVLLDIELEDGNIFQVLQKCKPYTFKPVFITAYNQYAIKAIKFSAIDYILKPVNEYEFCNAIQMALDRIEMEEVNAQTDNFMEHYQNGSKSKKMVLRTSDIIHIVNIDDVMYCKSDNSYTSFFLKDKKEIIVSKSMKEYAELLEEYNFLRPHQSYLVNLNHITKIDKADGGAIVMETGAEIPISTRRKQLIMDKMDEL